MKRAAKIIPVLVGALTLSCGKDEARPLLSEEERRRHNAPLEGEPCAIPDAGLLSGAVVLGEQSPGLHSLRGLKAHVDDCGNLIAGLSDFDGPAGITLVRVLRSGELDWKAFYPDEGEFMSDRWIGDITSDSTGSIFVTTWRSLLGFNAAGERHPVSTAYPVEGWSFLERIEDVWGDDASSSGIFVAGPVGYAELSLPSGYVFSQGSGGGYDGGGRVESAPLSSTGSLYFPEAELVFARGISVPQGGLVAPLVRLAVERVQVSYDVYGSPERNVVFQQDFEQAPHSFSLASRGGEYALAVTPQVDDGEVTECRSAMHWISKGASFEMDACPTVLDSLFTQDGSYWSLWTEHEAIQSPLLFRWEPGASAPQEVALEMTDIWVAEGTQYATSASLSKTPQGTVIVTAFSSDLRELKFVEVDAGE